MNLQLDEFRLSCLKVNQAILLTKDQSHLENAHKLFKIT